MIKVKDINGNKLKGIYKKPDGSIVVDNKSELEKIKRQRESVDNMKQEITDLKQQVSKILELLNGKH